MKKKQEIISVKEQMASSEHPQESNSRDKCAGGEAFTYKGMTGLPEVIFQSFELLVSRKVADE